MYFYTTKNASKPKREGRNGLIGRRAVEPSNPNPERNNKSNFVNAHRTHHRSVSNDHPLRTMLKCRRRGSLRAVCQPRRSKTSVNKTNPARSTPQDETHAVSKQAGAPVVSGVNHGVFTTQQRQMSTMT